jgi:hypothetical protein
MRFGHGRANHLLGRGSPTCPLLSQTSSLADLLPCIGGQRLLKVHQLGGTVHSKQRATSFIHLCYHSILGFQTFEFSADDVVNTGVSSEFILDAQRFIMVLVCSLL